jgi:hypothetical protein
MRPSTVAPPLPDIPSGPLLELLVKNASSRREDRLTPQEVHVSVPHPTTPRRTQPLRR